MRFEVCLGLNLITVAFQPGRRDSQPVPPSDLVPWAARAPTPAWGCEEHWGPGSQAASGISVSPGLSSRHLLLSAHRHWLSSAYTQFAVPYFIYDIYAMFLCHWHKHQVKGHGGDEGEARGPGSTWAVARGYLHKEFLMVLHHAVMVLVCFPLSVVSGLSGGAHWGACGPGLGSRAGRPGGRAPGGRARRVS